MCSIFLGGGRVRKIFKWEVQNILGVLPEKKFIAFFDVSRTLKNVLKKGGANPSIEEGGGGAQWGKIMISVYFKSFGEVDLLSNLCNN